MHLALLHLVSRETSTMASSGYVPNGAKVGLIGDVAGRGRVYLTAFGLSIRSIDMRATWAMRPRELADYLMSKFKVSRWILVSRETMTVYVSVVMSSYM